MDKGGAKVERGYPGPTRGYTCATFHKVRKLEKIQTANVTFKIIQGYRQQCH